MWEMVILGAFVGALLGHVRFRNPLLGMVLATAAGAGILYAFSEKPSDVLAVETSEEFQEHVVERPGPVVVDFYADWRPASLRSVCPGLSASTDAGRGAIVLHMRTGIQQ